MANQFSFQMTEEFLRGYTDYVNQLRAQNPGKSYKVVLSFKVIPNDLGHELLYPPQITVDEVEDEEAKKADTARRRTQGAKDGWEIRRGKQKGKQ